MAGRKGEGKDCYIREPTSEAETSCLALAGRKMESEQNTNKHSCTHLPDASQGRPQSRGGVWVAARPPLLPMNDVTPPHARARSCRGDFTDGTVEPNESLPSVVFVPVLQKRNTTRSDV